MRRWLFEARCRSPSWCCSLPRLSPVVRWPACFDEDSEAHASEVAWHQYLTSTQLARAVMENWQSEFLQFLLFILITVWLVQRGSGESKAAGRRESDRKQRVKGYDPRRTWLGEAGRLAASVQGELFAPDDAHDLPALARPVADRLASTTTSNSSTTLARLGGAATCCDRISESTLQNWQSEFLAVGSMAVFTIYLRQRGSPESKPVGAPRRNQQFRLASPIRDQAPTPIRALPRPPPSRQTRASSTAVQGTPASCAYARRRIG